MKLDLRKQEVTFVKRRPGGPFPSVFDTYKVYRKWFFLYLLCFIILYMTVEPFFFSSTCGWIFSFFRKVSIIYVKQLKDWGKKIKLKSKSSYFFFFCLLTTSSGTVCLFRLTTRTYHSAPWPRNQGWKPELSPVWCHCWGWDVSGLCDL